MSNDNTSDQSVNTKITQSTSEDTLNALALFQTLNDGAIYYRPVYSKICRSFKAGILLNILIDLNHNLNSSEFYVTDENLRNKIGAVEPSALNAAKKILTNLKFITITRQGVSCQSHYTINKEAIIKACLSLNANNTRK